MSYNRLTLLMVAFLSFIIVFLIDGVLFKRRKRSAESIYKLIVLAISCFENNKLYLFDNFNFNFKEEIFKNIWSLFKTNNRNKIQIIFSCNNVDFIKTNADKVLVLENGKIKKFDFIENFNDDELRNFINNNQDDDLIEDDEY